MKGSVPEVDLDGIIYSDDPRPLLLVHIGGAKCGSTAIQHLLEANRSFFLEQGFAVPNTELELAAGDSNQIWFFEELLSGSSTLVPEAAHILKDRIDALWGWITEASPLPPRGIILSAENLSNRHELHNTFKELKDRYRLCVVLYIRSQEQAYHSAWQQWYVKECQSIDTWLDQWDLGTFDWAATLERWESIEPHSISVRLLERDALVQGDIIDDFCDVLGLDAAALVRPKGDVNVSLGVHMTQLYHEMRDIFDGIHDHNVESHFWRFGGTATRKYPNEWLFTRDQFDLIRTRYRSGNAAVKDKYFPNFPRDELFTEIPATDTYRPEKSELTWRTLGVLGEASVQQHRDTEAKLAEVTQKLKSLEEQTEERLLEITSGFEKDKEALLYEIERLKNRGLFRRLSTLFKSI